MMSQKIGQKRPQNPFAARGVVNSQKTSDGMHSHASRALKNTAEIPRSAMLQRLVSVLNSYVCVVALFYEPKGPTSQSPLWPHDTPIYM